VTVGIILQARMGSSRLPGKVLKPLAGRPMLGLILERLEASRRADVLILASTTNPGDGQVLEYARRHHPRVKTFAGSEQDVLDRYIQAARTFGVDAVVRCTADNPLVDVPMLDALIDLHLASGADCTHSKTDRGNELPIGAGAEAYRRGVLETSWEECREPDNVEHVDEYIQAHPERFRIVNLPIPEDRRCPSLRLTVDTPEDFRKMGLIYDALYRPGRPVELPAAIRWCREQGWVGRG
jgi:spore coat polysaccharide biosynthesis protein SpsF